MNIKQIVLYRIQLLEEFYYNRIENWKQVFCRKIN
jgi:hypothetical protein